MDAEKCLKDSRKKENYYYWLYHKEENIIMDDILDQMGINKFYIYATGIVGLKLYTEIKDTGRIIAFIDRDINKQKEDFRGKEVLPLDKIPDDGNPIIITTLVPYCDVVIDLQKAGVSTDRLISIRCLLRLGLEYAVYKKKIPTWDLKCSKLKSQFLITGAGFTNKGAQAMLFVAVNEIKKRFDDAIIYFVSNSEGFSYTDEIQKKYNFIFLIEEYAEDSLLYELFPNLTAIVDVSGYALSSDWACEAYLRVLRMAKIYDVPLFLMPQSYGPFNFEEEKEQEIKSYLQHATVIFTREEVAYNWFCEKYELRNVQPSDDLVLQSKELNWNNIRNDELKDIERTLPQVEKGSNVAIVPNIRNFTFGNKDEILRMYDRIIRMLIVRGKHIYIICHSNDEEVCEEIMKSYLHNPKVSYVQQEMDCFEYEIFVRNFEFIIASRYHSIVHAYKQNIPCISIGWAEKYAELARKMQQESYVFDVRKGLDISEIEEAVITLDSLLSEEKRVIADLLDAIKSKNCFDYLDILISNGEKEKFSEG